MKKIERQNNAMILAVSVARTFTSIPNAKAAAHHIFKQGNKIGYYSCKCSQPNFIVSECGRAAQCQDCQTEKLTTRGTVMEDCVNLLAWLVLIELIENGLIISGSALARLMNISLGSAQLIFKKIAIVIENYMPNDVPRVSAERFKEVIFKRSLDTPALDHPYAEQLAIEKDHRRDELSCSVNQKIDLSPIESKVFAALTQTAVTAETLNKLTSLTIAEINSALTTLQVMHRLIDEDKYGKFKRAEPAAGSTLVEELQDLSELEIQELVSMVLIFLKKNFQGVSRKYLQMPLSFFWCVNDRQFWQKGQLLLACIKHPPITPAQLAAYTSPPLLKLMPLPQINKGTVSGAQARAR